MRTSLAALAALVVAAAPGAARAAGPEVLDQLEPGKGEWQAEYAGIFAADGSEHSLEVMAGVGNRLALGFEIEAERADRTTSLNSVAAKAFYRFTDPDDPVALGLQVQLGFGHGARLTDSEARLIAATRIGHIWLQGNAMLRHVSRPGQTSTGLAYAWSVQHAVSRVAWLGLEGSGQSAPLRHEPGADTAHGQFLGPSLTFELARAGGGEIEIGLALLRRWRGDGPANSGRLFVQFGF